MRNPHTLSALLGAFSAHAFIFPVIAPAAGPEVLNPEKITALPGFAVEHLYTVPKESQGSWVSLATGPAGVFYASDQGDRGLFRITAGEGSAVKVEAVSVAFAGGEEMLSGAQGLLWAFDSLWFHRNSGELYRLTDTDGDGRLDKGERMPVEIGETGGGEHRCHALALTEDGQGIYMVAGNHTPLAELAGKRVQSWDEDLLLPRMWDARGHARGVLAPGGWVTRFDPETKTQELFCIGFRNQYDIALNRYGDVFTFDADMEWDMGMPWYRPTRICHVVSGGDYGWRSGSGKWPAYYEDSLPAVVDIGPGSPTGVVAGLGARFPGKYQDAIYALDWTFGTIYAIHLTPDGAGYRGESEPFVYGAPLPVTDAVIGADGAMYFLIGGRGTQSAMFRVRYSGKESTKAIVQARTLPTAAADSPTAAADHAASATDDPAAKARALRRGLERFHGREDKAAIDIAWPHLASPDRFLRNAARVAVESQPVAQWAERVYGEADPQARITAAVALARSGDASHQAKLLASLLALDPERLSESQFLGLLRAYALAFIRLGDAAQGEREAVIAALDPHLPGKSADVNTELLRVLVYLRAPSAVAKGMALIAKRGEPEIPDWTEIAGRNERYGETIAKMIANHPPSREIGYAFILRNVREGWAPEQRRAYFEFLNEAAKGAGGASFPGFLANIRDEALANCTDDERKALADITGEDFNPVPDFEIHPPKGPGRVWTLEEALGKLGGKADFNRGRALFFATSCGVCHRFGGLGGGVGPDLTSIPNKFDEAYLLEAIINPSKDISDQYGSSIVTLNDGSKVAGLVVERGDEVDVYPPDPKAEPVKLSHSDVRSIEPSPVSQMPPGLINMLSPEELRDLVAYLMSGGDAGDRRYGKKK